MFTRSIILSVFMAAMMGVAQAELDSGYWVIVGNLAEDNYDNAASDAIRNRVRRCGFEPFNDFSAKFSGFRPGFNTFLLGAYASKAEANAILKAVKRCVPDAYIQRGNYAGE